MLHSIASADRELLMQWLAEHETHYLQSTVTAIYVEQHNHVVLLRDFNCEYRYTLQIWGNYVRLIDKVEYATIA